MVCIRVEIVRSVGFAPTNCEQCLAPALERRARWYLTLGKRGSLRPSPEIGNLHRSFL